VHIPWKTLPVGRCLGLWNNIQLVGGLEHFWFFHILGNNNPNWLSYFSEGRVNHQPAKMFPMTRTPSFESSDLPFKDAWSQKNVTWPFLPWPGCKSNFGDLRLPPGHRKVRRLPFEGFGKILGLRWNLGVIQMGMSRVTINGRSSGSNWLEVPTIEKRPIIRPMQVNITTKYGLIWYSTTKQNDPYGGFHKWGVPLIYRWMVYFMENPKRKNGWELGVPPF